MAEERRRGPMEKPDLRVLDPPTRQKDGSYEIRGYLGANMESLRKGFPIQITAEGFFKEANQPTDEHGSFGPIVIEAFTEPEKTFTVWAVGSKADPTHITLKGTTPQAKKTSYAPLSESLKKSWNPVKIFLHGFSAEFWRGKK